MALASPGDRLPMVPSAGARSPLFRLGVWGLAAVWLAVILISAFSPDQVSGAQQDHIPIAAILTWIWGLIASRSLITLLAKQREHPERFADVRLLVGGVAVVWGIATLVAIFGPVMVTGTDPTKLPLAAILAPIAAMVLTTTGCQLFGSLVGAAKGTPDT